MHYLHADCACRADVQITQANAALPKQSPDSAEAKSRPSGVNLCSKQYIKSPAPSEDGQGYRERGFGESTEAWQPVLACPYQLRRETRWKSPRSHTTDAKT